MREKIMADRMVFLKSIVRRMRAEISTSEFVANPALLRLFESLEQHLQEMEISYGSKK